MNLWQSRSSQPKPWKFWWRRFIVSSLLGLLIVGGWAGSGVAKIQNPLSTENFRILDHQSPNEPIRETPIEPALTAPGLGDRQEFSDFLNSFFEEEMRRSHIPGAVISVVKDGEVFFSRGYGYADVEQEIPVSADTTLFRVASISKVFTATAAMQLYENGAIALDEPVQPYLDFPLNNPYDEPINFTHLMTHTSGATQRLIGLTARTEAEMKPLGEYLPNHMPPILWHPGKVFSYSNHNIALLGYLVQRISGVPFNQYIQENILEPLGMQRTTFQQPPPENLEKDLAVGYQYRNDTFQPVPYLYLNIAPAASLSTTAADMSHFMIAQLQSGRYEETQILQPETLELMHETHFTPYPGLAGTGYGFREQLENGVRAIGHLGSLRGYSSSLTLLPDQNIGIFIATNSFQSLHRPFFSRFFDRYFPVVEEFQDDAIPDVPDEVLATFQGTYRDMEYPRHTLAKLTGTFRHIKVSDRAQPPATLTIQAPELFFFRKQEDIALIPVDPPLFQRMDNNTLTAFEPTDAEHTPYVYNAISTRLNTYERVAWYEGIWLHLSVVLVCAIAFLTTAFYWLLKPLWHRLRHRSQEQSDYSTGYPHRVGQARWLAGTVSLLYLIFLVGMPLSIWWIGGWKLAYGVPAIVIVFLGVLLMAVVLSVGLPVYAVRLWFNPKESQQGRSLFSLVALAAIVMIPILSYWNLVGFQF